MQPQDTLRMPTHQLDTLLGRRRSDDEPVFLLVRRRRLPMNRGVSIVLFVALVLGTVLLALLR